MRARRMMVACLAVALPAIAVPPTVTGQRPVTPPRPNCTAPAPVTVAQTEGPYYKAGSPERTSLLEPGMSGTRIILTGHVLSRECRPIARAWVDFWQANDRGEYDNTHFRLRGHQFADNAGIYYLETVLPGLYPGRTRHIHVKVRAPGGQTLTTQVYFPGESQHQRDGIFHPGLVATMQESGAGRVAFFNFVIDAR